MFFDNYLSYDNKVIIAIISSGIWIYFRTTECYAMVPRNSLFSSLLVMYWVYMYSYEPLVCPIGLLILFIYAKYNDIKNFRL